MGSWGIGGARVGPWVFILTQLLWLLVPEGLIVIMSKSAASQELLWQCHEVSGTQGRVVESGARPPAQRRGVQHGASGAEIILS